MEIQALRIRITQQDLNDFIAKQLSQDLPIENLALRLDAKGLHVRGAYPLFVTVSFDTRWEPSVTDDGRLAIRLARLKALGMPATALKRLVLDLLVSKLKETVWLELRDDALVIDVDHLLGEQGVTAQCHLRAIHCEAGSLTILAGSTAASGEGSQAQLTAKNSPPGRQDSPEC